MPLIIRTPTPPDVDATAGYAAALNVLDRRETKTQRQLRRGGLAAYHATPVAALLTLMQRSPAGSAFLDVGAGIGVQSALVSLTMGGRGNRCYAFEPTPEIAAIARRISQYNDLTVEVLETAVSDEVGTAKVRPSSVMLSKSAATEAEQAAREIVVPMTTVDEFCGQTGVRPYVVRIDVEDFETQVLDGAQEVIFRLRPWIICRLHRDTDSATRGRQLTRLEQLGYVFHAITAGHPWPQCPSVDHGQFRKISRDWLFAPQPLDDEFRSAMHRWLAALCACDESTNKLVRAGHPLPPGWNNPHVADRSPRRTRWASWSLRRRQRRVGPDGGAGQDEPLSAHAAASALRAFFPPSSLPRLHGATTLVLIGQQTALANGLAIANPQATVHQLNPLPLDEAAVGQRPPNLRVAVCPTLGQLHNYLARLAPPKLVVDDGGWGDDQSRLRLFKELFFYLGDGGVYAFAHVDAAKSLLDDVHRLAAGGDDRLAGDERELAHAIASVESGTEATALVKRGRHCLKLAERTASAVLTDRLGESWGKVLHIERPTVFTSRARVSTNRPDLGHRFPVRMEVPAPVVREYRDVLCAPRQLVTRDGLIMPASFHHPWARRLRNRATVDASGHFARLRMDPADIIRLDGPFFHLDSEFPGHYGHFTTEDIAKLWAWPAADKRYPGIRVLLSTKGGSAAAFQLAILAAFGIPASRVHVIDGPVRVGLLVGASQLLHNPLYVNPVIDETWSSLSGALRAGSRQSTQERIFVARPAGAQRACRNAGALEDLFAQHGFDIVLPERLSVGEQAALFAGAEVIAGYAGSAMFNAIYCDRPGARIVFGSESYTACNEYLISSVKADVLHYYWCHPVPAAGSDAGKDFHADFEFDFDRDGADLEALLRSL